MGEVRSWYHGNITSIYRDRLEDTIYCNDRRIAVGDTGINTLNIYEGHNRLIDKRIDLTCTQNDSYTVSTEIGNGALPEPIAMLTLVDDDRRPVSQRRKRISFCRFEWYGR